jgi:hypothetical protein
MSSITSPANVNGDDRECKERDVMTSSSAGSQPSWVTAEHVPAEELLRRQGIRPVESVDELACPDLFESDDELDEFISFIRASRHTGLA